MPPQTHAELVGGVVYMPSPLRYEHAGLDENIAGWIFQYRLATPGIQGGRNLTTILGDSSEIQPDRQLRLPPERGGKTRLVGGYVMGPPELIVEIAKSSRSYDLGPKKDDYERAGVLEYLFVGIQPNDVRWFALRDGRFAEMPPGDDGIYRSIVFPGLWLDPRALPREDLVRLIQVLDKGLATPEHQAFVAQIAAIK